MRGICRGVVLQALAPSERQTSRRAGLAQQKIGGRPSALVTRPPHLQYSLDFLQPRQRNRLTYIEHDNGVGIPRCDLLDQLVLIAWEREVRPATCPRKYHNC